MKLNSKFTKYSLKFFGLKLTGRRGKIKVRFFEILKKKIFFFIVDGIEISTTASFELDKPYSTQRNGIDEITLCTQTQVVQ